MHVDVVDAEGRPVSGAKVLARDEGLSDREYRQAWSAVPEEAVTDPEGVATFRRAPGKRFRLRAWTPELFGVATVQGDARSARIVVAPGRETRVEVEGSWCSWTASRWACPAPRAGHRS